MDQDIPQKPYYTIGEVSRITGVRAHVLRYWESAGKILRPTRRRSRHRLYRPADIQLIFEIKRLREEEKLTLAAMRRQLRRSPGSQAYSPPPPPQALGNEALALLHSIRRELLALKELLE
ncbi:MAG: MerR family transcriptional regulator [Deltaproteobacteria bacterium]|nr:MerR family transcriptional regulator [Deltaproteobacteria bacterium]